MRIYKHNNADNPQKEGKMKKVIKVEEVKRYKEVDAEMVILQITEQTSTLTEFGLDETYFFKSSKGYELISDAGHKPSRYSAQCIYVRGAEGYDNNPFTMTVKEYDALVEAIAEYNKVMAEQPEAPVYAYTESEAWKFVKKTDFGCHTEKVRKLVKLLLADCYPKKN